MDQGIYEREDGVKTRWIRWAASIPVEMLFAYAASRILVQKKSTRTALMGITGGLTTMALIICFSVGYRRWVWAGVAGLHLVIATYLFIGYYAANYKIIRFGFPAVYVVYGVFFLLGHCSTGVLNITGETWAYAALDIATKIVFWTYALHKLEIPEKVACKTAGPYSEVYMIHTE
jgi:bacteriorhodopsin